MLTFPVDSREEDTGGSRGQLELDERAPPPFFFAGPTRTVVAPEGAISCLADFPIDRESLVIRAEAALAAARREPSCLVGAVPFHDGEAPALFLAEPAGRLGRWWLPERPSFRPSSAWPSVSSRRFEPEDSAPTGPDDAATFTAAVRATVARIRSGAMQKAVLSRVKDVRLARPPELRVVLRRLREKNPHGFVFSLRLPAREREPARTLIGASPELLVSRRGRLVVTNPLAGSVPRSSDPVLDRLRASALGRSVKDLGEHRIVVEQILLDLAPLTTQLTAESAPRVIATSSMWHLSTRISGLLRPGVTALRLALALHPTPAVCGAPREVASAWIRRVEPFRRGLFTGALGYMDANGDGDFAVCIRCAEVTGDRVRIFAGAGIVSDSDAEAELAETEAKMATMLSAFGLMEAS